MGVIGNAEIVPGTLRFFAKVSAMQLLIFRVLVEFMADCSFG